MNPRVFREYDIRGVAERDLDDAMVRAIGIVIARKAGGTVVVGRDCRTHSPRLFAALTDGLRVHADVVDVGVVPTPLVAFSVLDRAAAGGIVITASHNPAKYNGYKVYFEDGAQLGSPHDRKIEKEREALGLVSSLPRQSRQATV